MTWNVQGLPGPAGPQGLPGRSGPVVVDAVGNPLGFYLGPTTLMNLDGRWLNVFAVRDGFSGPSTIFFQHLFPDCSGPRYGNATLAGIAPNATVIDGQAWVLDYDAPAVILPPPAIVYGQQASRAGPAGPCVPLTLTTPTTLLPFISVSLSAFVPPFTLSN